MEKIKNTIFEEYYNLYLEDFRKLNFNETKKVSTILDIKVDKFFAENPKSLLRKYDEL